MTILSLCFCFITLLSSERISQDTIVVTGKAENAKGGAIVISRDDKKMYYLSGMDSWDEKIIGKMVKVTGKLSLIKHKPPKVGEPEKARMIGIQRIILKPTWELVK